MTSTNAPAAPARAFDLIAFDLDGTVFPSPTNQLVSPRVCAAFQAAHDAGTAIAVASGRPTWMLGEQIPNAPWIDWAITCNGSRVSSLKGSDLEISCGFERDLAEKVLEAIDRLGGSSSIHTNHTTVMEKRHLHQMASDFEDVGALVEGAEAEARDAAAADAAPANHPAGNPIDLLLATFGGIAEDRAVDSFRARPDDQLDKVDCRLPSKQAADQLERELTDLGGVGIARLDETNFELTSAAASKGNAVLELCRRLGIDPVRAVAFGDSANDLSLTGKALTFVAMGNATDEVKAAADDVTDTVANDGVATWIEARL